MSEFVSRDLFDERTDKLMKFFESDKENLTLLANIVNQHDKIVSQQDVRIERLTVLEEKNSTISEETRNQLESLVKTTNESAALLTGMNSKVHTIEERLNSQEEKISEISNRGAKRWQTILTDVIKGSIMLIIGGIYVFLTTR